MNAITCVLQYLKVTLEKGILFIKNTDCKNMDAFTNIDHAKVVNDSDLLRK
jgi:hypothetical protein